MKKNKAKPLKCWPNLPQWIPCSKSLPEKGVDVLVFAKEFNTFDNPIYIACLSKDCFFVHGAGDDWDFRLEEITHWQPLPEKPEEK